MGSYWRGFIDNIWLIVFEIIIGVTKKDFGFHPVPERAIVTIINLADQGSRGTLLEMGWVVRLVWCQKLLIEARVLFLLSSLHALEADILTGWLCQLSYSSLLIPSAHGVQKPYEAFTPQVLWGGGRFHLIRCSLLHFPSWDLWLGKSGKGT